MSHKQTKRRRKMTFEAPPNIPDIEQQLIINYHKGGLVTFNFPKSMKLTGAMLGATIQGIMAQCDFKEPSRIQTLPPGTRLVG